LTRIPGFDDHQPHCMRRPKTAFWINKRGKPRFGRARLRDRSNMPTHDENALLPCCGAMPPSGSAGRRAFHCPCAKLRHGATARHASIIQTMIPPESAPTPVVPAKRRSITNRSHPLFL
jgi:hypothetical protein